jgi:hypothetical protein
LEHVQQTSAADLVEFVQQVSDRVFAEVDGSPPLIPSFSDPCAVQSINPCFEGIPDQQRSLRQSSWCEFFFFVCVWSH